MRAAMIVLAVFAVYPLALGLRLQWRELRTSAGKAKEAWRKFRA